MDIDLDAIRDMKARSGLRGRVYAAFNEWDETHDPCPVHPVHGPVLCPDIDIIEIAQEATGDDVQGAAVHVHQARIPAFASWEQPTHPENRAAMAMAEYFCACINAFHDVAVP